MTRTDPIPDVRTPPHSREAEQGILSSMLIGGPEVVEEIIAALATDAFFIPAHQVLFDTMRSLHSAGQAIDLITYTQALTDHGFIDRVAGAFAGRDGDEAGPGGWYVTRLFSFVPDAANVAQYLEIVREKWLARQMIKTCEEAIRLSHEEQSTVNNTLELLQGNVIELSNLRETRDPIRPIGDFVPEAVAQIKATYYGRGKVTGLATGFVDFDRMTNGLEPGYNYCIGARPAMGKTSFGLGLAEHIAVRNAAEGRVVQVFSLEMTGVQLARRMICAAASISLAAMRYGFLEKNDIPRVEDYAERLIASRVMIDDKAGLNVFEFRARARRAVVKRKAKLIIIDYLQMMHGVSRRARENRQLEVSECMQAIAETAKELQVPIVTLAQLSRAVEARKWGIPEMSDLRESGDIENYAHLIGLLWRPEYYAQDDRKREQLAAYLGSALARDEDRDPRTGAIPEDFIPPPDRLAGFAQIIIAKQREGATGPCPVRFVKEYARFESVTTKLFSNNPEERQQT